MWIKSFRRIFLCHQKDIKPSEGLWAHQKDDLSKRLWLQRWTSESWSTWRRPHSQCLIYMIHRFFLNVKLDKTEIQKEFWRSKKLVNPKRLIFLFGDVPTCWERKQHTSLSSLRLVDQKAQDSRFEVSTTRFWSLYKPWKQKRSGWNPIDWKSLQTFIFLNLLNIQKFTFCNFSWRNSSHCFVIANILLVRFVRSHST